MFYHNVYADIWYASFYNSIQVKQSRYKDTVMSDPALINVPSGNTAPW